MIGWIWRLHNNVVVRVVVVKTKLIPLKPIREVQGSPNPLQRKKYTNNSNTSPMIRMGVLSKKNCGFKRFQPIFGPKVTSNTLVPQTVLEAYPIALKQHKSEFSSQTFQNTTQKNGGFRYPLSQHIIRVPCIPLDHILLLPYCGTKMHENRAI